MPRREVLWRLVPVALLGVLGVAYVLIRPSLAARNPYLAIWEFPLGALVVALLLWMALGRRRPETPPVPWRRHEQVVRALPDPALAPLVSALDRWVETGEDPQSAADVLARARTSDPAERETLRAQLASQLAQKSSRRKRESLIRQQMETGA